MTIVAVAALIVSMGVTELQGWTFDQDTQGAASPECWTPNAYLANTAVRDGILSTDAVDWDPFLVCSGLEIPAKPWQYVVVTLKANAPGRGELFWTGETTGQYNGFSQKKVTAFQVDGDNAMHDVVIFPFWQTGGTIRQLRLDLYEGAHFEIDAIRIMEWGGGAAPLTDTFSWTFDGDPSATQAASGKPPAWRVHPEARQLFSPPLHLPVQFKGWVAVELQSNRKTTASILWSSANGRGLQSVNFDLQPSAAPRVYNIELEGNPQWDDGLAALGLELPTQDGPIAVKSIAIGDRPAGPPDIQVKYLGFENAINRTNVSCNVIACVVNKGGERAEGLTAHLALPPNVRFDGSTIDQQVEGLDFGQIHTFTWKVNTPIPGNHEALCRIGSGEIHKVTLALQENPLLLGGANAAGLPKADYVPVPKRVPTRLNVCAFYFPGWNTDAKWDCIRNEAPVRKPVLGYYDEANVECVDWQIKWAVENGITCFLVDWYWCAGQQHLTHWFDAYRQARYRDYLDVAIMWANHNAPGTHSIEDWRAVTRHWIDNYFNLPAYYRIDGNPAVFIWAPQNIRNDLSGGADAAGLGGPEPAKAALDESQEMARQAGYDGITFVAMGYNFSKSELKTLAEEGYSSITTYHEWGADIDGTFSQKRKPYKMVVKKSPAAWKWKNSAAQEAGLTYYPLVDTGWDSRPWHGDKALVIEGRTPELFDELLYASRRYAELEDKKMIVLGPLNEWGEGSYIEPCVEFGFRMYEAVRRTFCLGNPKRWPNNIGPSDIGLGPYDFPPSEPVTAWGFDSNAGGWNAMMGVGSLACSDGALHFETVSEDPAILGNTHGIQADGFSRMAIKMQLVGDIAPGTAGQLFWCSDGSAVTEATSIHFPLVTDGTRQTYTLDLKSHPRWRNRISTLRLDPCNAKGITVVIDDIRFEP